MVKNAAPGESSNVVKKSVEMICNNIAEMRTHGEGFVIVDQSPSAVDIAAIKNTNTKIVMRLPEKNDREAVGNAIGLNEEQIKELSKLSMGKAAVMQNNWLEAVLTSINRAPDTFLGTVPVIPYPELKRIRGVAIEMIMEQYAETYPNVEAQVEKLDELMVSTYKRTEFKRCLSYVLTTMKGLKNGKAKESYYMNAVLNISGARNLFAAMEQNLREARLSEELADEIVGKYDEENLMQWQEMFRLRLQTYLEVRRIDTEELSELLLRALAQEKAEVHEAVVQLEIEESLF